MFILLNWVKYYTKEVGKALTVAIIGATIILTVVLIKYKPAYAVEFNGEVLGYIENKEKIELKIKKYIEDTTGNIAFREQTLKPEYELKFVNRDTKTQEKEILLAVQESTITTYKTYAVTVDGAVKATVSTENEAKNIIDDMKSDVDTNLIGLNLGIVEQYTTDLNVQSQEQAQGAIKVIKCEKIIAYNNAQEAKRKEEAKKQIKKNITTNKTVVNVGTLAGLNLARPVNGSITSRYGSRSSIRSSVHTGLDIATSRGTQITAIAPGTVTYAGYKGSYGYLVIINHGNGVESYYAHCNELCTSVGQQVSQSTVIGTVGSTGNSTGPHLHLEIRQNGNTLNPENYLY